MERRHTTHGGGLKIEKRADGQQVLTGYAAVYYRESDPGTEYELWPGCCERIAPTAFDRAIREDDVRALFNHEEDHVLGRTKSQTCRLSSDAIGLRFEVDLPSTVCPENLPELIQRGDISGCSFSFQAISVEWTQAEDGCEVRTLLDVRLFDVGPVTFPAYEATSCAMRSLSDTSELRKTREAAKQSTHATQNESESIEIRKRLAEILA